jgi:ubiquinone/menaquinone biosynthesis C-methylase UbiE
MRRDIDYERWAQRYDDTRGASPSVLRVLLPALGDPAGRTLLDIGGGTGNVAQALDDAGFAVSLCDATEQMVLRAREKLRSPLLAVADAQRLPFPDAAFDCALSVNVLGHVPDWRAALREACRVIRDGPFVLKVSTAETQKANWVLDYLPQIAKLTPAYHYQPEEATRAALSDAGFGSVETERITTRTPSTDRSRRSSGFPPCSSTTTTPSTRPLSCAFLKTNGRLR